MKSVLTICVPTYNRVESLVTLIRELLKCEDSRFNIVVQDNCSTDSTQYELNRISDPRLFCYYNSINEGPNINLIRALTHCIGEYVLLCLDKDSVDIEYLPTFIDFLSAENPALGYVNLNTKHLRKSSFLRYSAGIDSIKALAYLSKHPTGYFYKSTYINSEISKDYFKNIDNKFPFPLEILNAHIALFYDSYIYDIHLMITESEELAKKTRSYTYNKSNLYFSPIRRIEEFSFYWQDIKTLGLDNKAQKIVIASLLHSVLFISTFGFQSAMINDGVLQHYNLEKEDVSVRDMLNIVRNVTSAYLVNTKDVLSNFERYKMLFLEYLIWGMRLIYNLVDIRNNRIFARLNSVI